VSKAPDKAWERTLAWLARAPEDAGAWNDLGALLRRDGHPKPALAAYARALAIDPLRSVTWSNRGNALADLDELDDAEASHRRAIELESERAGHWHNLAATLNEKGEFAAMRAVLDHTLQLDPARETARFDRALVCLRMGDYTQGWLDYESRWSKPGARRLEAVLPAWNGALRPGLRLLVRREQGFGDTLLGMRWLPELTARGVRVVMELKPELRRLFTQARYIEALWQEGEATTGIDAQVPLLSLPLLLGIDGVSTPPVRVDVPADARRKAEALLPSTCVRRIGIVWSGSLTFEGNRRRRAALDDFIRLGECGDIELLSLQKGPPQQELLKHPARLLVRDLAPALEDFADTAACLQRIDLLVMTDSSPAHLAGSLGTPVWNLLQRTPYWIYGTGGESTPWYPGMRLFRQGMDGEWKPVFAQVRRALGVG
jgi:tetratricopeptide (TPR) repeat protein